MSTMWKVDSECEPAVHCREHSLRLGGDLAGWDGGRMGGRSERENICIHKADTLHCTAETSVKVKTYSIKKNKYIASFSLPPTAP